MSVNGADATNDDRAERGRPHNQAAIFAGSSQARLACVLGVAPLLILDESTNDLDVDSIDAVQTGLRAHDETLQVVSHDEMFQEATGMTRKIKL